MRFRENITDAGVLADEEAWKVETVGTAFLVNSSKVLLCKSILAFRDTFNILFQQSNLAISKHCISRIILWVPQSSSSLVNYRTKIKLGLNSMSYNLRATMRLQSMTLMVRVHPCIKANLANNYQELSSDSRTVRHLSTILSAIESMNNEDLVAKIEETKQLVNSSPRSKILRIPR